MKGTGIKKIDKLEFMKTFKICVSKDTAIQTLGVEKVYAGSRGYLGQEAAL